MYHLHVKVLLKGYFWTTFSDEGIQDWNTIFVYGGGLMFKSTTRKVFEIDENSEPEIPTKKPKRFGKCTCQTKSQNQGQCLTLWKQEFLMMLS